MNPLRPLGRISAAAGGVAIGEFDLDADLLQWRTPPDETGGEQLALLLLRQRGWPVGVELVELRDGEVSPNLASQLTAEVPATGIRAAFDDHPLAPDGPLSVVVCTRDRPQLLARALERFTALRGPEHELIVVDNAPSDTSTRRVVAEFGDAVRYLTEPVPGLSNARNCGLAAAEGRYVAFTDDDVEPDPAWLEVIGATFAAVPGAVAVSGTVLPSSLSTRAELLFQEFGGYSLDFREAEYHLSLDPPPSPLFPFHPRLLGTGANTAFRTEALRALGGFDPHLGAGTPARGGEDIDIAVRVLLAGHLLVRQPAAVLWHPSHTDEAQLAAQLEAYGCGLSAVMTKFLTSRSTAGAVMRRVPAGLRMLTASDSSKNAGRSDDFPVELRRAERRGIRQGPFAYRRSKRERRSLTRRGMA